MRILVLFALLFSSYMFGQLSDKHWLPPLHSRSASNVGQHLVYLSTPEVTPFQVTVTNGNGVAVGIYTISAGNSTQFIVGNGQPSNMFVTQSGLYTASGNSGLILSGPKEFYVTFKVSSGAHGEMFVSKGRAGIGTDFRLGSSPQGSNDSNRNFVSSFMATQNNTTVTISGYDTGVVFTTSTGTNSNNVQTFVLQAGQSVVLSGYSNVLQNLNGFIGARLTSNKPIAVITGNITANPSTAGNDICLDQIVPVEKIGMEYIVVKGNGTLETELPIVIATEDNTQVFVNGNSTSITTVNAGDYYIVPFSYYQGTNNQNMYISTDKPVYLYQILAGDVQTYTIGMNFIPPLSCSYPKVVDLIPSINSLGSSVTFSPQDTNVILITVAGSTISINGSPITASPEAVLGNSYWETYRIPGYTGNVKVESTGPTAVGVLGLSGTIGVASFYSGFGTVNLSYPVGVGIEESDMTIANGLALCPGQTTILNTNLSLNDYIFEWTLNGTVIVGETNPSYTITSPGTYCVNLYSNSGGTCGQSDCMLVEYLPGFVINNDPDDLFSCDNNFDLNQNASSILNGLDPFEYSLSFFATMQDAMDDTNQINSLQTTTANTTFYVKVESIFYGCYQITQFDAITWSCNATNPQDMSTCDDVSNDGIEIFDLTSQNATILNGLNPTLYTISFYNSYTDAFNLLNPISNVLAYSGGPDETIFVRIQSNSITTEYYFTKFDLIVLPAPNAVISTSSVCEGNNGVVTITGTPNAVVQYSVDNGTNQSIVLDALGKASITTPILTSNSIYCLVSITTPCSVVSLSQCVTVTVNSNLIISTPPNLIIYEDPYDGYATFNLKLNESNILNGIDPLTVSFQYYKTSANASAGVNQILNPLSYTNSLISETIYVKVKNNSTTCSTITSFNLVILDSSGLVYIPNANFKAKLIQLGVDTNNDGEIQITEALVPTSLNVSNSNIVDLTGIEAFTNLVTLNCSINNLTTLNCSNNYNLTSLYFAFNSLLETVFIKNGSDESDTLNPTSWSENFITANNPSLSYVCVDENQVANIQSLVNASVNVNSYCTNNLGGSFVTISGNIIYDFNANGCDVLDNAASYMGLSVGMNSIPLNSAVLSNYNGNYAYNLNQIGVYEFLPILENPAYFTANPNPAAINVSAIDNSIITQNFCITANGVHPDLEIIIVPILTARPGFDAIYKILYKNKGNQTLSGNLQFTYNDAVLDYISSTIIPDNQSTGNLSWNYMDLKPFESRSVNTTLNVNSPTEIPAVNIGNTLNFSATINPVNGDENLADNTFTYNQIVMGSYDPNDKTCLEGEIISPDKIGNYLHYNINFENTGTAAATFIVVKDIIDMAKFDVSTLQILNASHSMTTRVNGNNVEFIFENINLQPNGIGNVTFKIKTLSTLTVGSSVANTANIYFDYNYPIETNTATSTFQVLSSSIVYLDNTIGIYPNPAKDIVNIKAKYFIKSIEIYDVNGRVIQSKISSLENESVDISNFTKGIYFLKIKTEVGEKIEKLIKQ